MKERNNLSTRTSFVNEMTQSQRTSVFTSLLTKRITRTVPLVYLIPYNEMKLFTCLILSSGVCLLEPEVEFILGSYLIFLLITNDPLLFCIDWSKETKYLKN